MTKKPRFNSPGYGRVEPTFGKDGGVLPYDEILRKIEQSRPRREYKNPTELRREFDADKAERLRKS